MKTRWIVSLLLAIGLVGMSSLVARADDKDNDANEKNEKVTSLDKIPAAAKDAITKDAGDNKIDKVEEGTAKDGKTYYEGHYTKDGKQMEVKVDADGKVLSSGAADEDEGHEHSHKDKDETK